MTVAGFGTKIVPRASANRGPMHHEDNRELQDQFDSRRLADRLVQITVHDELSDGDVAFI